MKVSGEIEVKIKQQSELKGLCLKLINILASNEIVDFKLFYHSETGFNEKSIKCTFENDIATFSKYKSFITKFNTSMDKFNVSRIVFKTEGIEHNPKKSQNKQQDQNDKKMTENKRKLPFG